MTDEGGYDFEPVDKKLFDEFYCPVCFKLMKDAVELQCGHSLCSNCLDNWNIKAGEMNRLFDCPQCRKPVSTEEVKQNKTINRIIKSSIRVKCTNAYNEKCANASNACEWVDGCEWIGVVGDVQEHLDKVCFYTVINCTYENCEDRFPRRCLAEHLPTCVYRSVFCKHCKESLVWNQMKEHLLKCDQFPVHCDNNGCQVLSARCLISKHQEEDCEYAHIKCQYASVGCQAEFLRRQQEDHDKQLITTHMALLLQNNNSVNKELEATKEELISTKKELISTKEELISTKKELISTTQRLENTEKRLKASNKEMEDTKQRLTNTEKFLKVSNKEIEKIKQWLKNTNDVENPINPLPIDMYKPEVTKFGQELQPSPLPSIRDPPPFCDYCGRSHYRWILCKNFPKWLFK